MFGIPAVGDLAPDGSEFWVDDTLPELVYPESDDEGEETFGAAQAATQRNDFKASYLHERGFQDLFLRCLRARVREQGMNHRVQSEMQLYLINVNTGKRWCLQD
jgi:hypothetical protein